MRSLQPVVALFFIVSVVLMGCVPVPDLVSSDSVKARYVGKHESVLIGEHGLPDQTSAQPDGGKICSWVIGTSSSSSTVYYGYGVYGGSSSGKQQKLTAYIDADGTVKELQTNGYNLGNEDEIERAKRANGYLGVIYGAGILSFIITLSLY